MAIIPGNTGVAASFPDGFLVGDGTVTAPTFRFQDTQTGFYRPGLNQIALASNGVQSLLVSATGLVTFNSGFSLNGGSAANLSIWSASNVLRQRGGTAGWAVDNTSGNPIMSATDAGTWTLGPASGSSSLTHLVQSPNTVTLNITPQNSNQNAILNVNGKGTGRGYITFSSDGTLKQEISVDSAGVLRIDNNVTVFAEMSAAGAWTLGPASNAGNLSHTLRTGTNSAVPNLIVQNTAATSVSLSLVNTAASMAIAANSTGQLFCTGVYGKTASGGLTAFVNINHDWGTSTSVRQAKMNIAPLASTLGWLRRLSPKVYNYRKMVDGQFTDQPEEFLSTGLIYDEVIQINPSLCFDLADGTPSGVEYSRLITPLLKALQELADKNDELEARLAALEQA